VKEVISPFYPSLVRCIWNAGSISGLSSTGETWTYRTESIRGRRDDKGAGASAIWGEAETAGNVQAGEEKAQERLSNTCKYLMGNSEEGGARHFSVVPRGRTRDNGHSLNCRRFHLNIRKNNECFGCLFVCLFFYCACGQTLEQVAWQGVIQTSAEHSLALPALALYVLKRRAGLDDLQRCLPSSFILWFHECQDLPVISCLRSSNICTCTIYTDISLCCLWLLYYNYSSVKFAL